MREGPVLARTLEKGAHASHTPAPLAIVGQAGNVLIIEIARRGARFGAGIDAHTAPTLVRDALFDALDSVRQVSLCARLSADGFDESCHSFWIGKGYLPRANDRDGLELFRAHYSAEPAVTTGR